MKRYLLVFFKISLNFCKGGNLTYLNANYMATAHTMRSGNPVLSEELMSRFEGRIWIIDAGISRIYNGVLSALIIENGKFTVWWIRDDAC